MPFARNVALRPRRSPASPIVAICRAAPRPRLPKQTLAVECVLLLLLASQVGVSQTGTASIRGTVTDAKTQKPVPGALVTAVRGGLPAFSRNTKTGADGAFQLAGLPAGNFSLCVQAMGDSYLDPCQWNGSPTAITVVLGQTVSGVSVKVTAASILRVQVQDPKQVLNQKTKDGRTPDLTVGIWGPKGLFYPAHGGSKQATNFGFPISYQIAIPRDTALKFHIASHDLKLGDANGATLPGNTSQVAFQHITGDPNPKSFSFTVLGLLP